MKLLPRGKRDIAQAAIRAALGLVVLLGGAAAVLWWGMRMPGRSFAGPAPALTDHELASRERLRADTYMLAGTIGERNMAYRKHLDRAAEHLASEFRRAGYPVREQVFEVEGAKVKNLEVEHRGTTHANELVVVGGHYDSVIGSPGADDNATGAAMVVELARLFATRTTARSIRFVAFVNEEPPYFQHAGMGSREYSRLLAREHAKVVVMFSLESLGCFTDSARSQQYPPTLGWFYPNVGNYVAFVGNLASRPQVREAVRTFRDNTAFPAEGLAAPGWVQGVDFSDHWSFWQQGWPGIMVTDTAVFRNRDYHTDRDLPEAVDYKALARITRGMERVVGHFAGAPGEAGAWVAGSR